jgi:predicted nucleic acid-binding protein
MKKLRVYFDTSVIGGCLDDEFSADSLQLLEIVSRGQLIMLPSEVVSAELSSAPSAVQDVLQTIPVEYIESIELTSEIITLAQSYLAAGVLTPKSLNDAIHVAAATIARADAIVSWNFKHIVRLDKMKQYNQVNLLNGYGILTIVSPKEVSLNDSNE